MGKTELVALLNLSTWCLVMVERRFLAVPQGCLRFMIVVFPDHTHLLFLYCDLICTWRLSTTSIFLYTLYVINKWIFDTYRIANSKSSDEPTPPSHLSQHRGDKASFSCSNLSLNII